MEGLPDVKVDPASQDARKLFLLTRQREVGVAVVRLELDQHVDVAVGPKVVAEHRTEQSQPPDVVAATEIRDLLARNLDACSALRHGMGTILRLSMSRSSTILPAIRS